LLLHQISIAREKLEKGGPRPEEAASEAQDQSW
jgi:hypothetical protein